MLKREKIVLLTEGKSDVEILTKVLPSDLVSKIEFIPSMGYSGALSKAKSLAVRLNNKIILVLDSDTNSEFETQEKKEQIESIFRSIGKSESTTVFLFQPEIEVIFSESKSFSDAHENELKKMRHLYNYKEFRQLVRRPNVLKNLTEQQLNSIRTETSLKDLITIIKGSI